MSPLEFLVWFGVILVAVVAGLGVVFIAIALKIVTDPTMAWNASSIDAAHWPAEATQQMKDLLADPHSLLVVAWAIAALPADTFIPVQHG